MSVLRSLCDIRPTESRSGDQRDQLLDRAAIAKLEGGGASRNHRRLVDSTAPALQPLRIEARFDEASAGDAEAGAQRLVTLHGIPRLELTEAAAILADDLVTGAAIPREAIEDALHVAVAAAHGMDYLLTWNCRHIANAAMRNRIADICASSGVEAPVICTPEELLED